MQGFALSDRIREQGRQKVGLLLASVSHSSVERLLRVCGTRSYHQTGNRYRLGEEFSKLCLLSTTKDIDIRFAASSALIYACWWSDYELVKMIIDDLHVFIDINMRIGNMGTLRWALASMPYDQEKKCTEYKINICRLLIVEYGSKLEAICKADRILWICAGHDCADIVEYLVTAYGSAAGNIDYTSTTILKCLVKGSCEETAKAYLLLPSERVDCLDDILEVGTVWSSLSMFQFMMNMFKDKIDPKRMNIMFRSLCSTPVTLDREDKIKCAYSIWADHLVPETIRACLIENWKESVEPGPTTDMELHGLVACCIIELCMNLICDESTKLAMALCCRYLHIELLDILIDRNLEQIQSNPKAMTHALIECAINRDIETFEHILERVGSCISAIALEIWADAGDLSAVTMALDVGIRSEALIDSLPEILCMICERGDVEVTELLIQSVGDSIKGTDHVKAFRKACESGSIETVQVLIKHCRPHLDFSSDTDYGLVIPTIKPGVINLLNKTFGTSLDPELGSKEQAHADSRWKYYHFVEYKNESTILYSMYFA